MASAVPAMAASHKATATTTPHYYHTVYGRSPTSCSSTNPYKGFVDAMPCTALTTPANTDCENNPDSSQGFWINSADGGTVNDQTITVTYKFNKAVVLDQCPYSTGYADTSGSIT